MTHSRSFCCVFTLALLLTACDSATNQTYVGPPLARLKGTMTAREGLTLTQPVRLAIAWFALSAQPGMPGSEPRGVVTDEVSYTGTFPQAFTFALPSSGVTREAAFVRPALSSRCLV